METAEALQDKIVAHSINPTIEMLRLLQKIEENTRKV